MKLGLTILLFPALLMLGCNAGSSAELTGLDAIMQANAQVRAAVGDYDRNVAAGLVEMKKLLQAQAVKAFSRGAATQPAYTDDAEKTAASLMAKIDELMAQESARQKLLGITTDNLDFIDATAKKMQDFIMYRADVDAQWKAYLTSQMRFKAAQKGSN